MINDAIKYEVIQEFWYKGNHYFVGEKLILPYSSIISMGENNFKEVKCLTKPLRDKMIRNPICSKEIK